MAAELAADADLIQCQTERSIDIFNILVGTAGFVWFRLECRAPNFPLSFRKRDLVGH